MRVKATGRELGTSLNNHKAKEEGNVKTIILLQN